MIDSKTAPYGALLLRVVLGSLFLAHAGLKYFVLTPAGTAHFFASLGVPPVLGLVVMAAEIIFGVALILGVYTRIAAVLMLPDMLGAIFLVHIHNGFFFNNPNGGWEYPAFWSVALVVQALVGDGALALVATPSAYAIPRRRAVA